MENITERYSKKRAQGRAALARRVRQAYALAPELEEIGAKIRQLNVKRGLLRAQGLPDGDCAAQIDALRKQEQDALKRVHLPVNQLEHQYECELCKDTGLLSDGTLCPCAAREQFAATAQLSNLTRFACERFDTWDLTRFPEEDGQRAGSARLKDICLTYANSLPQCDPPGLLLRGATGLGKSFAAHAVGNAALQKGLSVKKYTANQMFDLLMDRVIDGHDRTPLRAIVEADLFILDDLGAEPQVSGISEEYVYVLLDERLMAGRATVVTTNCSPEQLCDRYGRRTTSRLFDHRSFRQIILRGRDIRGR